jgi:tetratricopeptide (TPR) repeat protein
VLSGKLKNSLSILAIIFLALINPAWSDTKSNTKKILIDDASLEQEHSKALESVSSGDYSSALPLLKHIVDQKPNDARANMDYGGTLFISNLKYFDRERKPGFASEALPTLKQAMPYLEKVTELCKTDGDKDKLYKSRAYSFLGAIYQYGFVSLDEAEAKYRMALSIDPKYEAPRRDLKIIEEEKGTKVK